MYVLLASVFFYMFQVFHREIKQTTRRESGRSLFSQQTRQRQNLETEMLKIQERNLLNAYVWPKYSPYEGVEVIYQE